MPRDDSPTPPSTKPKLVSYDEFRTGLTFAEVRQMLWVASDNPEDWRYKRRHTVLGYWRQLKQKMYDDYCERYHRLCDHGERE